MDLHTSARDPFADGQDDADEAGVNHRWLGSARAEATSAWAREVARAAARDSHAKPRQRYSVQKPTHKQPKKTGDARFGITVNTHFSTRRRAGTTGRPHGQTQRTSPRTQRPNGGGFVSLADLNALDHQESTPEKRPVWAGDEREAAPVGKGQTGIEAAEREAVSPVKKQGTLGQPAVHTKYELSPVDRPIVIGLAVSSAPYVERSPRTGRDGVGLEIRNAHERTMSDETLVTPTILITPAQAHNTWSPLSEAQDSDGRSRAASSCYSQESPDLSGPTVRDIPPVPNLPSGALYTEKSGDSSFPDSGFAPGGRDSTSTLFEEDESPQRQTHRPSALSFAQDKDIESPSSPLSARSRSMSFVQKHLSRSSTDTSPAGRTSRGWWNYVLPPFLSRSNTGATRTAHDLEGSPDEVPELPRAGMAGRGEPEGTGKPWDLKSLPASPDSASPNSAIPSNYRKPAWTDLRGLGQEQKTSDCRPRGPTLPKNPRDNLRRAGFSDSGDVAHEPASEGGRTKPPLGVQRNVMPRLQTHTGAFHKGAQASEDKFSPNDREVPMLFDDASPLAQPAQSHNPFLRGTAAGAGIQDLGGAGHVPGNKGAEVVHHQSPSSAPALPPGAHLASPPPYSPPRPNSHFRKYIAIMPPNPRSVTYPQPHSPGPVSPGMLQAMASGNRLPMSEMSSPARAAQASRGIATTRTDAGELPPRSAVKPVTLGDIERPSSSAQQSEQKRRRNEKEDALAKKVGGLWRGRGCFSSKGCLGRGGPEARKRRRLFVGLTVAFVLMIILIIALATTLTRRTVKEARPQSRFLNVTGWPAIPTGVSTVAQPDVLEEDTSCVFPSTMWSCSLPKELHEVVAPSSPNQPNLKVEIKFRNDSAPPSESSKRWDPSPAPPGLEEQQFIGNTTDKVVDSLKEGEETPFYMSILATPSPPNVRLQKRADEFPDITATIPPPDIGSDGTANAANLLPLLDDQPLRLYDRGLATEHYGFYNYFDRSIFLRSVSLLNQSDIKKGEEPADQRGGSTEEEALVRCTWAQTRFLVQIWTQRPDQSLLPNATASATGPTDDFARPGSFPYPITIATDRHGGDVSRKMIYCYGLDHSDGTARVVSNEKKIQVENRGFGGELVGGGQGPLGKDRVTLAEGGMGGIDGGTGGCACRWRNFRGEV